MRMSVAMEVSNFGNSDKEQLFQYFEAEGFGLPCTTWAGLGLLVKSRFNRIRADDGVRKRTRTFEIPLIVLAAAAGRDIPIKRADRHAIIYYVMHHQAWWDNVNSVSYLIT